MVCSGIVQVSTEPPKPTVKDKKPSNRSESNSANPHAPDLKLSTLKGQQNSLHPTILQSRRSQTPTPPPSSTNIPNRHPILIWTNNLSLPPLLWQPGWLWTGPVNPNVQSVRLWVRTGRKAYLRGRPISKKYSPSCITYISPCITW